MNPLPRWRIELLRATYLLVAVGLALVIWPLLLQHGPAWAQRHGSTAALLGGVSVLALIGLWHPLKMLPLLLFELVWKLIWMLTIALPLWLQDQFTPAIQTSFFECLFGVLLLPLVLPWRHVWQHYLRPTRSVRAT